MADLSIMKRKLLEEESHARHKKSDDSVIHTHKSKKSKKEKKMKKSKKKEKKKKKSKKSSSECSSDTDDSDEWVEKSADKQLGSPETKRDDWMQIVGPFKTFSRDELKPNDPCEKNKQIDSYNPSKNSRELNPYWKDNGTGLPSLSSDKNTKFRKPVYEDTKYGNKTKSHHENSEKRNKNWQKRTDYNVMKKDENEQHEKQSEINNEFPHSNIVIESNIDYLNDEEMNKLGAKLVKAEICGNTTLVQELTAKLERAREYKKKHPGEIPSSSNKDNDVMLTITNSQGNTIPLSKSQYSNDAKGKERKRKMETHSLSGDRVRFFADDDKYSLKQMFEKEKFGNSDDTAEEFVKIISKHKSRNDDLDDIFTDKISRNISEATTDSKNRNMAISQHTAVQRSLDSCLYCIDSEKMNKTIIVSLGKKCYIGVPERRSLVSNHCFISTIQHTPCVTMCDEDIWSEILVYRKALTNMFNSRNEDVIFFETAIYINKYPHLIINCVPLPRDVGDTTPIYFKKALLECETEWSNNKKVVDLKGKDIRKGIPKGLPYFWVDFGMSPGYAHVIEDQNLFPRNFAQEIVGGVLDLDHKLWRKPHKDNFESQNKKVNEFLKLWRSYDPHAQQIK